MGVPASACSDTLKGEDVDWSNGTVSFTRKKTIAPVVVHLGTDALNQFKDLPGEGPLFPYLSTVRAGDRATEFGQRCRQLGIRRRGHFVILLFFISVVPVAAAGCGS